MTYKYFASFVAALIVILGGLSLHAQYTHPPVITQSRSTSPVAFANTSVTSASPKPTTRAEGATEKQPALAATALSPKANVTLSVSGKTYATYVASGGSVLDAMKTLASTTDFTYTGQDYPSLGFFVDSINGKESGGGNYWFLYVNGASSNTGASQTVLRPGDVVEWRYEQSH